MSGDEEDSGSLRDLIGAYHDRIFRRLVFRLGDYDLAEDLARQVWAKAWEKGVHVIADVPQREAALFQIVWNEIRNHEKKRKRRGERHLPDRMVALLVDNSLAERMLSGSRHLDPEHRDRDARAMPFAGSDADPMGRVDLVLDLRSAMRGLSPRQQEALYLSGVEGLSHAEIARRMDISRQGVEKQLKSAMKKLRSSMAGWDKERVRQ